MEIKIYDKLPDEAKAVREEVFICEQGFSYDCDEIDDIATHIVMFDGDAPIGACRVYKREEEGTYMMGRLAVKKDRRGQGLGGKLVNCVKEYVSNLGGKSLILHAQLQARDFYLKTGFEEYGEIEYEENCPHIWMRTDI